MYPPVHLGSADRWTRDYSGECAALTRRGVGIRGLRREGGRLRFGSLFSGIGGLDLGLERAGMECRWQVEIDEWCRQVLDKRWPNIHQFADIHDVGASNLEPVDLVVGGFPCQPVSITGQKKAQADERWLWPEFARVLRELRPSYALLENVPGLFLVNKGKAAQEVFRSLAELGYDAEWATVSAAAVGAPHRRSRVFILAYTPSSGRDAGSVLEWESVRGGDAADAGSEELPRSPHWEVEPDMDRMADGIPNQVDRLRGLGNAVVPQVAEWVGRRIVDAARNK
jgi:DNA (cytosine-5)-methyltransferase 1